MTSTAGHAQAFAVIYTFGRTAEVAADLVAQGVRQGLYLHPGFKSHDLFAEQSSTACFGAGRLNELRASTAVNGMAELSPARLPGLGKRFLTHLLQDGQQETEVAEAHKLRRHSKT